MRRHLLVVAAALVLLAPRPARADLDSYLAKPEPAFKWEKKGEESINGCRVFDLAVTSLEWQGHTWTHRLVVIRHEKLDHPKFCTLYNTGGNGGKNDVAFGTQIAKKSGTTFAMLFGIPNQPLWGKTEDALVVHTWLEFLKSFAKDGKGDESWPLHFPMAKAVIKAMDVVQAHAKEMSDPIEGFLVCGASKRGWTSWLVGASRDARVKAIAPMVIDVLNVEKQARHQLASWGKPSEQIKDYSAANMLAMFSTPAGKRLLELEDPYSYRDRLTLPKLIVNGTNDRYWTQDALNLYWDDLQGPKWVLYVPNSGHKLEDRSRVTSTLCAFARTIAQGKTFPALSWKYEPLVDGSARLTLESNVPLEEAQLFSASAPTLDLRESKWDSVPMTAANDAKTAWTADAKVPADGHRAVFGEAVYVIDGMRFSISSQIKILSAPSPSAEKPATEKPTEKPAAKSKVWY